MKKLLSLIFLLAAMVLHAQEDLTVEALSEKVFELMETPEYTTGYAAFNPNGTFYMFTDMGSTHKTICGTYSIDYNSLWLYPDYELVKMYNSGSDLFQEAEVQEGGFKLEGENRPYGWHFKGEDGFAMWPTEFSTDGFSPTWDIKRQEWLKNKLIRVANPLEGLEEFTPQNDSLIIARYLAWLNTDFYYIDENGLTIENRTAYTEGKVTYDPDNNFKIFVFSGDDCGAHCNGMYASLTQYANGYFEKDSGFYPIESFQKIANGRYAIVTSEWYGGMMGMTELELVIYTLDDHSLEAEEMFNSGRGWPGSIAVNYGDRTHAIKVKNPWWGDYEQFDLRFDPKTNKISYSYTYSKGYDDIYAGYIPKKVIPLDEDKEAVQITGEFILDKGEITRFKEHFEKIKIQRD